MIMVVVSWIEIFYKSLAKSFSLIWIVSNKDASSQNLKSVATALIKQ